MILIMIIIYSFYFGMIVKDRNIQHVAVSHRLFKCTDCTFKTWFKHLYIIATKSSKFVCWGIVTELKRQKHK